MKRIVTTIAKKEDCYSILNLKMKKNLVAEEIRFLNTKILRDNPALYKIQQLSLLQKLNKSQTITPLKQIGNAE